MISLRPFGIDNLNIVCYSTKRNTQNILCSLLEIGDDNVRGQKSTKDRKWEISFRCALVRV